MMPWTSIGWHWLKAGMLACVLGGVGGVWAQPVPPLTLQELSPYWDSNCSCYRMVPWGTERWFEAVLNREVGQVYELWLPAVKPAGPMPVIIWAHASGKDHVIQPKDSVHKGIVVPAHAAGMAVVSVEYRHPVNNAYLGTIYHDDLLQVIQYIRTLAPAVGLDTRNVFLAGRSRGSLAVWTAMQDDRAQPEGTWQQQQSTRVNAVFSIEAQTTYVNTENALYLYENERAAYLKRNPGNPLYGSAVGSATADDPPVLMRYPLAFYRRLVHRSELTAHHPDYGLTLCQRYAELGLTGTCTAEDLVPATGLFSNVIPFFQAWLKPPG